MTSSSPLGRLGGAILGDNYPDPFTEQTTIPYKLPEETKGKIIITDVLGRTVEVITIVQEENEIELKTNDWENGIYYYSLIISGKVIETKKMILQTEK